jgi:hypothetical protein
VIYRQFKSVKILIFSYLLQRLSDKVIQHPLRTVCHFIELVNYTTWSKSWLFKGDDLCDYFLQDKGDTPQFNGEEEKGNIRRASSTPIIKDVDSKGAKGRKLLVYIYSVSIFYMTATNLGLYYGTELSSSDDNLRIVFLIIFLVVHLYLRKCYLCINQLPKSTVNLALKGTYIQQIVVYKGQPHFSH